MEFQSSASTLTSFNYVGEKIMHLNILKMKCYDNIFYVSLLCIFSDAPNLPLRHEEDSLFSFETYFVLRVWSGKPQPSMQCLENS